MLDGPQMKNTGYVSSRIHLRNETVHLQDIGN